MGPWTRNNGRQIIFELKDFSAGSARFEFQGLVGGGVPNDILWSLSKTSVDGGKLFGFEMVDDII